jgi:hypothetical protein
VSGAAVERGHQPAAIAQRREDKTGLDYQKGRGAVSLELLRHRQKIKPMKRARIKLDFSGVWNEPNLLITNCNPSPKRRD